MPNDNASKLLARGAARTAPDILTALRRGGGSAAVDIVFTDHFQRVAHAHFTLRRLERSYGSCHIKEHSTELAAPKSKCCLLISHLQKIKAKLPSAP